MYTLRVCNRREVYNKCTTPVIPNVCEESCLWFGTGIQNDTKTMAKPLLHFPVLSDIRPSMAKKKASEEAFSIQQ